MFVAAAKMGFGEGQACRSPSSRSNSHSAPHLCRSGADVNGHWRMSVELHDGHIGVASDEPTPSHHSRRVSSLSIQHL